MDIFIRGKNINLVVVDEEVVSNKSYYNWFNDEELTEHMQQHYFPNTESLQKYYYESFIQNNKNKLQLGITDAATNILIGMISLNSIDFLNQTCEIAGLIGEKKYQSMSYFTEANVLLIRHAFLNLNMNRVEAGMLSKSLQLYHLRVLGFVDEGVRRKAVYKNGEFNNAYNLGILKEEFENLDIYKVLGEN